MCVHGGWMSQISEIPSHINPTDSKEMEPSANECWLSSESATRQLGWVGIRNRNHGRALVTDLCIHDNKCICFHSSPACPWHFNYTAPSQCLYILLIWGTHHNSQTTPPCACRGITYIDYKRHDKHDQDELQLAVWYITQENLMKLQEKAFRGIIWTSDLWYLLQTSCLLPPAA